MGTGRPYRMIKAVLIALFLLGGGTLASMYMKESLPRDRHRVGAGLGAYVVSPRLTRALVPFFLPKWYLNIKSVAISRERNAGVLESVFEVFDPSLRSFLTSVPIVFDSSADTAKAYPAKGCIGVSPDWDNNVRQSRNRAIYEKRGMRPEDPVFMQRFKTDLLIHEFLHILESRRGIDSRLCYEAVARWYSDRRYGTPSPNGMFYVDTAKDRRPDAIAINRMKYILWHELYNYQGLSDAPRDESWKNMQYGKRYRFAKKGVEEFAYIGQEILSSGSSSANYIKTGRWCAEDWKIKKMRLREVSPEIIALFRGVFNPELTEQQMQNQASKRPGGGRQPS